MGVEANSVEHLEENVEALLEAARYGDLGDLRQFLFAALDMAAANGHLGIVEYLIGKGMGKVEMVDSYKSKDLTSNEEKNTPLHWACLNGHIEFVKKLVLAGANVITLNSHERTPIDVALSRGKMEVIEDISTARTEVELARASVS